jgi:DNA-binding SARP family transcriptional activator
MSIQQRMVALAGTAASALAAEPVPGVGWVGSSERVTLGAGQVEVIRFRLLGEVRVEAVEPADHAGGAIASIMCRGLLWMLLLNGPARLVSSRQLIASLWDTPPPSAKANLRTYRTNLQRTLARAGLHDRIFGGPRGQGYGIRAAHAEVDVLVFRHLVTLARQLLQAGAYQAAVAKFVQAFALYRGSAGEDLPSTTRLIALAQVLNNERTVAAEEFASATILAGNLRDAITLLEGHLGGDPTAERAWALLACAHYMRGDAGKAQFTIRRGYHALDRVAGLEPGIHLRDAERAVIRRDDSWFRGLLLRGR